MFFDTPAKLIWKAVEAPLKAILGDKFSILKENFYGLMSSVLNDLDKVIRENFSNTLISFHFTSATVGKRGAKGDDVFRFYFFPLDAMADSSKFRDALAKRLQVNTDLGAAAREAEIQKPDWDKQLVEYSGNVWRVALPYVVREMLKNEKQEFSAGYYLIDYAEHEASIVKKEDVYSDLIVLFRPSQKQSLSDARKTWRKRHDKGYEYVRDKEGYDGFKAA